MRAGQPDGGALPAGAAVCVTGAGGFVASWLVAELLGSGRLVRGTVRARARASHLTRLTGSARLTLYEADLQTPGTFDAPVDGCHTVFHTASPYVVDVADPQRDLVAPAVEGTFNVLRACRNAASVRRVVLTSSMAAVTDEPDDTRVLTADDWNTRSSLHRNPYYFSKVQAERAAWDFMARERPAFALVVLNPFVTMGPSLGPDLNTSNRILVDLVTGTYPAILRLYWGIVDVRDLAHAHVRAAEVPAAAGRYLCAQPAVSMRTIVGWLREAGLGHGTRLPSRGLDHRVGDWLVWLDSYRRPPGAASYLRTHIGRTPRYDTRPLREDLGVELRPTRQTILDTMADLVRRGHVPPPAVASWARD
jgi:dihydroflavonol-4-reductase